LTKVSLFLIQGCRRTHLLEHIRAEDADELGRSLGGSNGSWRRRDARDYREGESEAFTNCARAVPTAGFTALSCFVTPEELLS